MEKIAIIIPCYNEAKNLHDLFLKLKEVFATINADFVVIFIDNKSTDASFLVYNDLIKMDSSIHVIFLSRNFGSSQPSILAGIRYALLLRVNAAVIMDADLQDPPEVIAALYQKWKDGFLLTLAVRKKRIESFVSRIGYFLFYRIYRFLSLLDISLDASDFCMMDRIFMEHLSSFSETDVLIKGLRAWIGFQHGIVEYERPLRKKGESFFGFLSYLRSAKDTLVGFSDKPLEYISYLAIVSSIFTGISFIFYFYFSFSRVAPQGFFTLIMAILFFGTLQLFSLGVIAEYLIRIFREVKKRPPFIVEKILTQKKEDIPK